MIIDVEITINGWYSLGKINLTLKYFYLGVILIYQVGSLTGKEKTKSRERERDVCDLFGGGILEQMQLN